MVTSMRSAKTNLSQFSASPCLQFLWGYSQLKSYFVSDFQLNHFFPEGLSLLGGCPFSALPQPVIPVAIAFIYRMEISFLNSELHEGRDTVSFFMVLALVHITVPVENR